MGTISVPSTNPFYPPGSTSTRTFSTGTGMELGQLERSRIPAMGEDVLSGTTTPLQCVRAVP